MQISNIGIVGAGTMGSGISQIAALTGYDIVMQDVSDEATSRGLGTIDKSLQRLVDREKITADAKDAAIRKISTTTNLSDLADCDLVIEAATENMALKLDLFEEIDKVSGPETIIASNTSSLSLTKLASVSNRPDKVIGMHFFNPAPAMALVEVVQSTETDSEVADLVFSLAEQWGKIPVHVRSSPGFIVNRAARPFYSEALAILKEGGTDAATCDAIIRECGGFRMGPFELMDLIGLDVNYAVTYQIWESYRRHPRFAPSMLQKELVDSGRLGRKSGQGFFEYGVDVEIQAPNNAPESPAPASIIIEGPEKLPQSLLKLIEGGSLKTKSISGNGIIRLPAGAAFMISNGKSSTERSLDLEENVISLDLCLDYFQSPRIALAPASQCSAHALQEAVGLFQSLGKLVSVLKDIPGMVLTRTVAMLSNEASLLVQEEISDAAGVNLAMRKGVNYPQGPLEWAEQWGLFSVVETLDNLRKFYGERYQVSSWLQKRAG